MQFAKLDVPCRDLPIHGKRVTVQVIRRRYTCRASNTTFRPQQLDACERKERFYGIWNITTRLEA